MMSESELFEEFMRIILGYDVAKVNTDFAYGIKNDTVDILNYISKNPALVIPDFIDGLPVVGICGYIFFDIETGRFDYDKITSVYISTYATDIQEASFFECKNLESITVAPDNSKFSSENGVWFNKDKSTLIQYPMNKLGETYIVPDEVEFIYYSAFIKDDDVKSNLTEIIIPNSVDCFGFDTFKNYSDDEIASSELQIFRGEYYDCFVFEIDGAFESLIFRDYKNITIICDKGSPAHQYAINANIPFRLTERKEELK